MTSWPVCGRLLLFCLLVVSCGRSGKEAPEQFVPVDARCEFPASPDTIRRTGSAVLLLWEFEDDPVFSSHVLPRDDAFLGYRAAVRADGADRRWPLYDEPTPRTDAEAELWRNEQINAELARSGKSGSIAPITCLDALLFAHQNARVSQLKRPTEFLASVLRHGADGEQRIAVVFGGGDEMFPPKSVYGFDVVDEYVARGWRYIYALHNHTLQANGERLALGTPALSTSDVQLTRNRVETSGLESTRVTNGFFTYTVMSGDLGRLRSR